MIQQEMEHFPSFIPFSNDNVKHKKKQVAHGNVLKKQRQIKIPSYNRTNPVFSDDRYISKNCCSVSTRNCCGITPATMPPPDSVALVLPTTFLVDKAAENTFYYDDDSQTMTVFDTNCCPRLAQHTNRTSNIRLILGAIYYVIFLFPSFILYCYSKDIL